MIFSVNSRDNPQFGPMDMEQIAQCAKIHADAFAVGWTESELEALVVDRNVASDCATSSPDGRVQGFVMSRVALDEAEILTIAVRKSFRGNGIGEKLLNYHINTLEKIRTKYISLEVSEDNEPAIKLYRRMGFTQIGIRKSYYPSVNGGRSSALTMKLVII